MGKKPSDNTYYIAFDTQELPGALLAVRVTIDQEVIRDMERELPINLCEHPLYDKLATYVIHNRPRKLVEETE